MIGKKLNNIEENQWGTKNILTIKAFYLTLIKKEKDNFHFKRNPEKKLAKMPLILISLHVHGIRFCIFLWVIFEAILNNFEG